MNQPLKQEPVEPIRYYRLGRFIVDIEAKRVAEMDGTPVDVTGKSYLLLETLVLAAPGSVSLADLHEKVWPNIHVSDDTVRQRVKLLRQALAVEPEDEAYVRAEHGAGYAVYARPVRPKIRRRTVPKYLLPIMLALVVLTPVIAFFVGSNSAAEPRVFVTPFLALEKGDERLAAGFTGELIDKLAPITGLSVAAVNNGPISNRIEGSFRVDEAGLTVAVRIVDTNSGDFVWVREYKDRPSADIYSVQANIAAHVALVLQAALDEEAYQIIEKGPTSNTAAYYAYMLGRGYLAVSDTAKAEAEFARALAADPEFTLAKEALASLDEQR